MTEANQHPGLVETPARSERPEGESGALPPAGKYSGKRSVKRDHKQMRLVLVLVLGVVFAVNVLFWRPTKSPTPRIGLLVRALGYKPPSAQSESPLFRLTAAETGFDTVIDVGAFDCTDYTIPAAKSGYRVYAFELVNVAKCETSLRAAKIRYEIWRPKCGSKFMVDPLPNTQVVLIHAGASDRNACVGVGEENEMATVRGSGQNAVMRIDDLGLSGRVYELKIDTQGHEVAVLRGAAKTIRNTKPEIVAMEFWPAGARANRLDAAEALEILSANGYACFDTGVHEYNLPNRPATFHAYTKFVDATHDAIGDWDDLVCGRIS